jgi:hypothetical protein
VRRYQNVDEVDLQQAEPADRAAKMIHVDAPLRPRLVEALSRQGDPTRLRKREIVARHRRSQRP